MDLNPSFFSYYFIAIITAIIVYIIGHISLIFVEQDHENTAKSFSLKLFSGVIVLVSLFAIIETRGNTIFCGLFIILIFIFYFLINTNKISFSYVHQNIFSFEFKEYLYFLLLLIVFLSAFHFLFGLNHANPDGICDFSYYAAVGNSMLHNGIETNDFYINLNGNQHSSAPTFYHYFELWFAVIVKSIFSITTFDSIVFIVQPILFTLLVIVVKGFIKQILTISNSLVIYTLPLLIVIISSSSEIFNLLLPNSQLHFTTTQLLYYFNIKLSVIYICILFFLMYRNRYIFEMYIPLGLLCILYPTTFPVIVTGILFFNLYLFFIQKKPFLWRNYLPIISVAIFIVCFYSFNHLGTIFINKKTLSSIVINKMIHFSLIDVKHFIGDMFYFYFPYILYAIPSLIIFKNIVYRKSILTKNTIFYIALFILMFIISGGVYCLLFGIPNADQIQKNLFFTVFNIACLIILLFLFEKRQYFIFILYLIINFISLGLNINKICLHYTTYELSKEKVLSKEFSEKRFSSVYIKNSSDYKTYMDRYIDLIIPYPELRRYTDSYYPECLSIFEIPKSKDELKDWDADDRNDIPFLPFYKFAGDNTGRSLDSLKKEFIVKYKVDYLFLEKGNKFSSVIKTMPVEKRMSFDDEPYEIIKFKWKQNN